MPVTGMPNFKRHIGFVFIGFVFMGLPDPVYIGFII
jgi:hypothetical protein